MNNGAKMKDSCKIVLNSYYVYCIFGEEMFRNPSKLIQLFASLNISATVQEKNGVVYLVEIRG